MIRVVSKFICILVCVVEVCESDMSKMYTSTQILLLLFVSRTAFAGIRNYQETLPHKNHSLEYQKDGNNSTISVNAIENDEIKKSFDNIIASIGSKSELMYNAPTNTYGMRLANDDIFDIWNNIAGRQLYINNLRYKSPKLLDAVPQVHTKVQEGKKKEREPENKPNTNESAEISKENIESTKEKDIFENNDDGATSPTLPEEMSAIPSQHNKTTEDASQIKQNINSNESSESTNDNDAIEKSFDNILALIGTNNFQLRNTQNSKTYGMKLSDDQGYIWNDLQKPGIYYNIGETDANKTIDMTSTEKNTSEVVTTEKSTEINNFTDSTENPDEANVSMSTENVIAVTTEIIEANNVTKSNETTTETHIATQANNTTEDDKNLTPEIDELNNGTEKATKTNVTAITVITDNINNTTEAHIPDPESKAVEAKDNELFNNITPELAEMLKKYIKNLVKEEVAKLNCAIIDTNGNKNCIMHKDDVQEVSQDAY